MTPQEQDDKDDDALFRDLALMLGMVCGTLSRKGMPERLITMLQQPGGDFTHAVLKKTHERIGLILKVVQMQQIGDSDGHKPNGE